VPDLKTPASTDWPLVLMILGAGMISAFQVGKAPPSLPLIRAEQGLSLVAGGWILSVFNLIGALGGLLAGTAAGRLGHRRLALTGLVLLALGSLAGGLTASYPWLLASRVTEGLGYTAVVVTGPVLIYHAARPADLRLALGVWSCFMPAGTALMMVLSPLALEPFGWRWLWLANAILVALFIPVWARVLRRTAGPTPSEVPVKPRPWPDLRSILTRPGPLLLAFCFLAYALQWLSLMGFLPTLLMEDLGLSGSTASLLTAVMVAFNIPGNLTAGWLLQKGVRRVVLLAGAAAVLGLCGLGVYSPHLAGPLRYLLCLVFSSVGGMIPASLINGAAALAPRPSLVAATNGLNMQGAALGAVIGPPALAAVVAAGGGWQAAPYLLVSMAGLGILLGLLLGRIEEGLDLKAG